jgi:EAL domain-containing protein (putative c-di-GMP-specific phosphodiesterase class I)/GGDEF domain-containing protein
MRTHGSAIAENLLIAGIIFACSEASRMLGYESSDISLFWPTTSLALVFGLRRGWHTLLGSLAGIAVWTLFAGYGPAAAIYSVAGFGTTTALGLWILEAIQQRRPAMGLTASLGVLMFVGVFVTSPLAATVGSLLMQDHELAKEGRVSFWFGYWLVEAVSAAIFIPALAHNVPALVSRRTLYESPRFKTKLGGVDVASVTFAIFVSALILYLAISGQTTWAKLMLSAMIPICFLMALPTSLQGASIVMMIGAVTVLTVHAKLTGQQLSFETQVETFVMVLLVFEGLVVSHFGWTVVTERELQSQQLKLMANQSESSGLPNRRAVTQVLKSLREHSGPATLIEVQIRDLFRWADIGGHDTIASIEKSLGERVQSAFLQNAQIVGHIGTGRYFIFVGNHLEDSAVKDAFRWAVDQAQFIVSGRNITVRCVVGVVDVPEVKKLAAEELMSAAALATQEAVSTGSSYLRRPFSDKYASERRESLERIEAVKLALAEQRIRLMAQPIVAIQASEQYSGGLGGQLNYEILTRLIDEHGQEQAPSWFLPAIARARLNKEFDRAVILKTLRYLASDDNLRHATKKCSINVTGNTICDPGFAAFVLEALRQTGIPATIIVVEVTESESIADFSEAQAQLRALKAMGVGCAVDDFGVGLATFDYIKKLRPDWIKIDGSFVSSIGRKDADPLDAEIIAAAVQAAKALGARTVAEHVETQTQIEVLTELGVDYLQGFALSRPLRIETIAEGGYQVLEQELESV